MAIRILIILCLVILLDEPQAHSQPDSVYYTESGFVEFASSVPLHSFTGESEKLTGMIDREQNLIDFYLDLNTLETGIGKRDRDMYETLNADKYPFAEFTGSFETGFSASDLEKDSIEVTVTGDFTINNVSNPMTITGVLIPEEGGLKLKSQFEVNLDDHDIKPPGILFYRVDEVQKVTLNALLKQVNRDQVVETD